MHKSDPDGGLLIQPTPAPGSSPLAVVPPNGVGMFATGQTAPGPTGALWYEVQYPFAGVTGWVHSAYVTPVPSFASNPCSVSQTDYGYDQASIIPPVAPAAVSGGTTGSMVYALHHMSDPDCERTVITFGAQVSGDYQPADNVPPMGGATVPLPGASAGLLSLDFTADVPFALQTSLELFASQNGVMDAFVTRHPGPYPQPISLDMKFSGNRAVRVWWAPNPIRLVIDTIHAPTGTGMDLAARVGDLAALMQPINWDLNGPLPVPPITVTGWARPFEATLQVSLRTAPAPGAASGTGTPVAAGWSGVFGASPTTVSGMSSVAFDTTDYGEAWGWFEFTITQLGPGTYELFAGDTTGGVKGVFHVFTVGP